MRAALVIGLALCTADAQIVRKSVKPHGDIVSESALTEESVEQGLASDMLAEIEELVQKDDPASREKIKTIMDLVDGLFPTLEKERDAEKEKVGVNLAAIDTCNKNSVTYQKEIKDNTEPKVVADRSTHATCREEEKNKESNKNGRCGELDTFLASVKDAPKKPAGRDAMVKWVEDESAYYCPKGPEATEKDEACKTAEKEHAEHKADCDRKQRQFETTFCLWRTDLTFVCDDSSRCYEQAVDVYNQHKALAEKLVEKWKVEWKSLKKIRCYVDVWMNNNDVKTADADQYSKCQELTIDASVMEIDFGKVPAKVTCDLEPVKTHPGTQEFPTVEYSDFSKYAVTPLTCLGEVTAGPTTEVMTTTTQPEATTTTQPSCTDATKPTDLVKNGEFSKNMAPWTCFNKYGDYVLNGCHLHSNYKGHDSTGHLHGNCHRGTQGGIQQEVSTSAGTLYKLKFVAFEGDWDGDDHDSVHVKIENSDKSSWTTYTIHGSNWEPLTLDFTANGPTKIIMWADKNHCIDVDDVQLLSC
jgi:hypothetical protein